MGLYTQQDRHLSVTTPLGTDVLMLRGFTGTEAVSKLFRFELDVIAEAGTVVPFEKLLGQKITFNLALDGGVDRPFNGICSRVSEGAAGLTFTPYTLEVVPQVWFLTRVAQSRIFQQVSVPDILKTVFGGLDVDFQLTGEYASRDYCVQYRETDFHFASRLMEEEGIFYFFKHDVNSHTLVVADNPQAHPVQPNLGTVEYETSEAQDHSRGDRITVWKKSQELRSGKFTLWDHCFELPHKHLEADAILTDSVQVGSVTHKLKLGKAEKLEIYDYPGGYAQRFDGINPGGGDRSDDLQHIFEDNKRTVGIRMQEEAAAALLVEGEGFCRQLTSGHKFTAARLGTGDGDYITLSVEHDALLAGEYRSGTGSEISYTNKFTCIPAGLAYRPPQETEKPVVSGTQTAVVVGGDGDEIFVDKYGRIKVQFMWDRQGTNDSTSSCWVRVASFWAGKQWGAIHIPRVGQEVVIAFEEGDPDRPIVVGSVYNADMMPPYDLPDNKTQSGVKSRSTPNGTPDNFNELRFEDKKGSEQVYFHAEKDFDRVVENNDTLKVGFEKMDSGDQTIEIFNNQTLKVGTPTSPDGSQTVAIQKDRSVQIAMGNDSLEIKMGNQSTKLDLGASTTEALQSIELKVGQSSIKIDQMGVTIKGMMISVEGQVQTEVKGLMTNVSADAMLMVKGAITMIN